VSLRLAPRVKSTSRRRSKTTRTRTCESRRSSGSSDSVATCLSSRESLWACREGLCHPHAPSVHTTPLPCPIHPLHPLHPRKVCVAPAPQVLTQLPSTIPSFITFVPFIHERFVSPLRHKCSHNSLLLSPPISSSSHSSHSYPHTTKALHFMVLPCN